MRRLLGRAAVLVLLCDLAVAGVRLTDRGGDARPPGAGTDRVVTLLPPGQAEVTGVVDSLTAAAERVDTVPVPFTVEASRAVIAAAVAGGRRVTAVWNGGPPLRLEAAGGGLDPSPAVVAVGAGGVEVRLDGTPRPLTPGEYRTAAPLAVGSGGLAAPRDGLAFTADGGTTLTADGALRGPHRRLSLDGPGTVEATGRLQVRTGEGERTVTRVSFGPGAFELVLEPSSDGRWSVTATLNGRLEAG